LGQCRDACGILWGLDLELGEIRQSVAALEGAGQLVKANGGYRISPAVEVELKETQAASERVEAEALSEWEATLRSVTPGLTDDDLSDLREDLQLWLRQVITRHGVEAALILYPDSDDAHRMLGELEKLGLDFLPRRNESVEAIRERAFFLFVVQPTEKQQELLSNLMHTAYFLTVLTLDPEAKQLVQDVAKGQIVYLDTNILYRVLNLNTPRQFLSANRLLTLTRELGYQLAVTPWTVAELRYSLERARDYLKSKPLPPGELAALAAEATTDENFIVAYWRRIKDKPVSVDDFFDFHNEIEVHLAEHGIEVIADGCIAVDRDEQRLLEEMSLIDRVPGPRVKPDPVKEHDAKHRLLVLRRRGDSPRRFATAGFWFLTADSSLPRYDYLAQGGRDELSFCATASAWTQVMRSFVPRTQDMDQTLTDLLSSPYIRYRGRISYDTVREVASRLELFRGSTPGIAASVLMNTALLREVAETPEDEAREQLIDNAVVAAAADLERQLEDQLRRAQEAAEARHAALADRDSAIRQLATEKEAASLELETKLGQERRDREAALADAATALEEERTLNQLAVEQLRAELDRQGSSVARMKFVLKAALAGVMALVAALATGFILYYEVISGALSVSLLLTAAILVETAALSLVAGWKRAWVAFGVLGLLIGLVAAIYQLQGN
jgi:hypothetical protein